MPAPWAAGVRVRIIGKVHNKDCIQVIHFATNTNVFDDPTGLALLKALANAVAQCVVDQLLGAVTSDYTYLRVEATKIAPTISDSVFGDVVGPLNGDLPAQGVGFAAQLGQVRTGGGGRSGRGRNFWPPASEAVATAGNWDAPQLLLLAQFFACIAAKFMGAAPTTEWRLGVLSRKKFGEPPVAANFDIAFREATELLTEPVIAVMGTRKLNRGS